MMGKVERTVTNLRIEPALIEACDLIAKHQRRSRNSMMELMLLAEAKRWVGKVRGLKRALGMSDADNGGED